MAKLYIGVNNKAKEIENFYIGVNGQAKKIKKGYVGVGNKAKLFYTSLLPSNYFQQVEYIANTGKQYIDTDIKPNSNYKVYIKYKFINNHDYVNENFNIYTGPLLFGAIYNRSSSATKNFFINPGLDYGGFGFGSELSSNIPSPGSSIASYATDHEILFNDGGKVYYDNELVYTIPSTASFSAHSTATLKLLGASLNSDIFISRGQVYIYKFKVWNNNNLILEMYPCYRKIDNVIGMYDVINNNFYINSGSEKFTKGPNV